MTSSSDPRSVAACEVWNPSDVGNASVASDRLEACNSPAEHRMMLMDKRRDERKAVRKLKASELLESPQVPVPGSKARWQAS